MRRSILLMVCLFLVGGMFGCTVARKPGPAAKPRTVVVPETTRVSFERIDPARAPQAVKDVARALDDTNASTWVRAGNDIYLLLNTSSHNRGYRAEVTEISQRTPRPEFSWLDVKARYIRQTRQAPSNAPVLTVVRVSRLARPVSGVAFQFDREKGPGTVPMQTTEPQT
ncbi:MAG: hypothetical protein ACPLRU_09295, partial [Desulfofundulus sp.]